VLLVLTVLTACAERVDVDALTYRCASDDDCRAGRFCHPTERVCVASLPDTILVEPDAAGDAPSDAAFETAPEPAGEPDATDVGAPEGLDAEVEAACVEGASCDDGDPCTLDDACTAGLCVGRIPASDPTCDGRDDDCDGEPDDDYLPEPLACGVGACAAVGATRCVAGHVLLECVPAAPGDEVCNLVDDDCDGLTDAADVADVAACDLDGDGHCAGVGPDPGSLVCPAGLGDCDDAHAAAHPGGLEVCDPALVDENCDGRVNEDPLEADVDGWPGVTKPEWIVIAGAVGWHELVSEEQAWLGTPHDVDVYRAALSFPAVAATVVQVRAGPFEAGALRRVCLFASTPEGSPGVICQGLATEAVAPDASAGCCRETTAGGLLDVAATLNLAGAQQAALALQVEADGGACDTYRVEVATAQ
jgi:hypothetical protein